MSEYGIKIKNIEAATLYEYNKGLRDHYEYKDALFVNSLFKDFMCENNSIFFINSIVTPYI